MTNAEQKVLDAILDKERAVIAELEKVLLEDVNSDFLDALQKIHDDEQRAISDFLELMDRK